MERNYVEKMITAIMKRIARTGLIEIHRSQRHVIAHTLLLFLFLIKAKARKSVFRNGLIVLTTYAYAYMCV